MLVFHQPKSSLSCLLLARTHLSKDMFFERHVLVSGVNSRVIFQLEVYCCVWVPHPIYPASRSDTLTKQAQSMALHMNPK